MRAIARPETNQRTVYNGHKNVHALKFQAIALPNGLIGNLYGPVEGCRHDAAMLRESQLLRAVVCKYRPKVCNIEKIGIFLFRL